MFGFRALSQENYNIEKYLKRGAVPVVDGKVVFSDTLSIVDGYTVAQINDVARSWLEKFFQGKDMERNRILSEEDNRIVALAQMEIVFQNNSFSMDKALMSYVITLNSMSGKSTVTIDKIRYNYNDGVSSQVLVAEDYITDEEAVNKKGTKLLPITGKFRRKTIDAVEEIFGSYRSVMKLYTADGLAELVKNAPHVMSVKPVQQKNDMLPERNEGYVKVSPEELPENFIKMVSKGWMLMTEGSEVEMKMESWGGAGVLYNKPVAICFISPADEAYSVIEKENTYKLVFYNSSVIIVCRKLVAQSLMLDAISDEAEKGKRVMSPMHKMYIGEILNVWVKE